jgi:quercetin dioxygenase-like cupin family protein
MTYLPKGFSRGRILAGLMIGAASVGAATGAVSIATAHEDPVRQIFSVPLPNVPGKSLSAVMVSYEPGGKSPSHNHHSASVFAFIVSGAIRSENSATGPAKVYKAGESFFEPPGSIHSVSENASTTEPASLLAVFVADDGAELTEFHK